MHRNQSVLLVGIVAFWMHLVAHQDLSEFWVELARCSNRGSYLTAPRRLFDPKRRTGVSCERAIERAIKRAIERALSCHSLVHVGVAPLALRVRPHCRHGGGEVLPLPLPLLGTVPLLLAPALLGVAGVPHRLHRRRVHHNVLAGRGESEAPPHPTPRPSGRVKKDRDEVLRPVILWDDGRNPSSNIVLSLEAWSRCSVVRAACMHIQADTCRCGLDEGLVANAVCCYSACRVWRYLSVREQPPHVVRTTHMHAKLAFLESSRILWGALECGIGIFTHCSK